MTVQVLPWSIQGQSHSAEIARNVTAGMLGAPVLAFTNAVSATTAGGSHGVLGSGSTDLAVSQNGTPNMSVNVAAGRAFIRSGNASSIAAGTYAVMNDATVNVAIAAADPTNPRIDLVVIQVRDTNYGEAASDARITVVTGTPAASPAVPALTLYPNALVLAQVAVAAAATTIVTANITDKRTFVAAVGGTRLCTSTTRPSTTFPIGQRIFEIDTGRELMWDNTGWVIMSEPPVAFTPTLTNVTAGNGTFDFAYRRSDGWIDYYGRFTFGSTSSLSGLPGISVPVAPFTQYSMMYMSNFNDNGATVYQAWASISASRVDLYALNATGTYLSVSVPSATVPFTWTTGDSIDIAIRYRMATRYS